MPKVGKMKFPYTEQGIKEAANYAKNSGKPMEMEGNYRGGGHIPKYQYGGMVPNQPMMPNQSANPRFKYGFGNRMVGGPRPQMGPGMRPGMGAPRPMGGGMSPAQSMALRNRLAKFKKGIV